MPAQESSEHALQIARWVVQGGADREAVAQLFQEYSGFLARGVEGSFTQLLYVRELISKELFDRLQVLIPPPGLGSAVYMPGSGARAISHHERQGSSVVAVVPPPPPPPPPAADAPPATSAWGSGVRTLPQPKDGDWGSGASLPQVQEGAPPKPPSDVETSASERLRIPLSLSMTFSESIELPPEALSQATMRFEAIIPPGTEDSTEFHPMVDLNLDSTAQDLEVSMDELSLSGSSVEWERKPLPIKPPKVGGKLGPYELTERLGRGGMGLIFKARSPAGEEVAVKVLLPKTGAAGEKARKRFDREIKALARLEHRNLVGVRDSGSTGPFQWYVMDFVEGRSLDELIASGEMIFEGRLRLFTEVCEAIAHAHEQGVIHRDLKPGNVILDGDGHAIVLDLGLAKLTGKEEITVTRTGATLGTPFYMAPEQLLSPKDVDVRADVYALGVVLYELVTGKRPFSGETFVEVSKKIVRSRPKPPTARNASLPAELDDICAKALAKRPKNRYATVLDLLEDVSALRRPFDSSVEQPAAPKAIKAAKAKIESEKISKAAKEKALAASKRTKATKLQQQAAKLESKGDKARKKLKSTGRVATSSSAPPPVGGSGRFRDKAPAQRKIASERVAAAQPPKGRAGVFLFGLILGVLAGMAVAEYTPLRIGPAVDWIKAKATGQAPATPQDGDGAGSTDGAGD